MYYRCCQRPDGSAAPPEPDPGDDEASEPAPPPSAAPPLCEPPLGPVGDDWTGVCWIGCAPEDAQDGQEEVGEAGELDGADDEYDGAVAAGPPDAEVGVLAGAFGALTGGLVAGAGAEALGGAPTFVVSPDPRDTRRLGLYDAAGTSGELAEPPDGSLCAAVRLDAASLPERVAEELSAPMMSAGASSKTASATRRRRRMVARLGRCERPRVWRSEVGAGIFRRDSGKLLAPRHPSGAAANATVEQEIFSCILLSPSPQSVLSPQVR